MKQIQDYLKEQKQLKIVKILKDDKFSKQILVEKDNSQYVLKMNSLSDGMQSICKNKLKAYQNKAKILKDCNHPGIIQCFQEFLFEHYYFILLEKCDQSLKEWQTNGGSIDNDLFTKIAIQLLDATNYLHTKNYFIRDLCPSNIFLTNDFKLKIKRFGIAKQYYPSHLSSQSLKDIDDKSFQFLIPEMQEFYKNGIRKVFYQTVESDIWMIGICLYSLLGASTQNIIQLSNGSQQFQNQVTLNEENNLILKYMLSIDPQQRPDIPCLIQSIIKIQQKYDQSKQLTVQNNEILFKLAQQHFEKRQMEESFIILKALIEKDPQNDLYLAWMGRIESCNNNYEECINWCNKALEINQKNDLAFTSLGVASSKQGKLDSAIIYYHKALEISPQFDRAIFNLGLAYDKKNIFEEAIRYYKQAIKFNPKFDNPTYNLAIIYHDKHQNNLARLYYKQTISINPEYDQALNNLGVVYFDKAIFEKAIKNFKKAYRLASDDNSYIQNIKRSKRKI